MKSGLITLIPKGNVSTNLDNFRGITLNNVDLKIFTKMLHLRLCPFLVDSIHSSQYSTPGKKEWELNNLVRDLFHEMKEDSINDAFLVRVDFCKAFDSLNMDFLYKVMAKMGFPPKFIAIIQAIDTNVFAKVIINGAKSKKIQVGSGTRQGDPLSMDKYIIGMDP